MKKLFTVAIAIASLCLGTHKANAQYCTPGALNCDETINNFTLNTINNSSLFCSTPTTGYTNFTNLSTTLMAGQAYPFSITIGPSYVGDTVYLWIDLNQNTVFESTELLKKIPITIYAAHDTLYNSSITIPLTATAGSTRLRARVGYIQAIGPCGVATYGEAEDYTVNIVFPPCTGTPVAASITTAPVINHLCNLATQTITAVDNSNFAVGISYQWQQSLTGLAGSWTNVVGGTGANTLSYTTPPLVQSIYYRIVDSCSNTQLTNASPSFSIPVSPSVIGVQPMPASTCIGGGTSFSMTPNGNGFTYQWQVDTGTGFNNISNSPTYSGVTNTTLTINTVTAGMNGYNYRVVVSGGCQSPLPSSSAMLIVGATAKITTTRPTTFCSGDSVILTANSGANYVYQWFQNGALISGNQTYVAKTGGTYSLLVIGGNTGCTASDVVNVTVNPSPAAPIITVNGSNIFCWGNVVPLTTNYGGIVTYTYQWYHNNANIVGVNTTSYLAPDSGSYSFLVLGANGCSATSNTVHLKAIVIPVPLVTNNNDTLLCLANTYPYAHYQWYMNGSAIPGATTSCYQPTVSGTYYLGASDSNNCSRYSISYSITIPVTGVANVAAQGAEVRIYPNPVASMVNIKAMVPVHVDITSVDGRVIMHQDNAQSMNITSLSAGMYMMRVYNIDNILIKVEKLVKE